MYSFGENYNKIFEICSNGLNENPDDELLTNVMRVLNDHDAKYGIKYKIVHGVVNFKDLIK